MERSTGKTPEELCGPEFPDAVAHVWGNFLQLHHGRSYGMSGPNPLSWPDMKAWCDLTCTRLSDWEIAAIKELDSLWLRVMSEGKSHD